MVHVVLVNCHWIPIVCLRSNFTTRIFVPAEAAMTVANHMSDRPQFVVVGVGESCTHNMCGAMTLDILALLFCGTPTATSIDELECRHLHWKHEYNIGGFSCPLTGVYGFGPQGTLTSALATELIKHGVPKENAEQRAHDAIRAHWK